MENKKIIANFQGLRGYAILLIFISHSNFGLNTWGVRRTIFLGTFGVSLFIMLSGYLLMESHKDEPIKYISYVKRKILKFYPLHILTLLMALPFSLKALINMSSRAWIGLISNLFLIQAWIPSSSVYFSYNAVSWYLSITIFFVLVSPIVLKYWDSKKSIIQIVTILLLIIVFDSMWCMVLGKTSEAHWLVYIFPPVRMLEFAFGGGLWKINNYKGNKKADIYGILGIIISVITMIISVNVNSEWFSVVAWLIPSALMLIFVGANTRLSQLLFSNRIITRLGDISFEFFLVHWLIIRYTRLLLNKLGSNYLFLEILVSFILSILIAFVIQIITRKIKLYKDVFRVGRDRRHSMEK